MFSWTEILLIAVVALIFIGPKELPSVLHKMGQITAQLRRSAEEFRRHFDDAMREAGYQDLHKNINDLRSLNPSTQLRSALDSAINQSYAPKPPPAGTQPSAPPSLAGAPQPQSAASAAETPAAAASGPGLPSGEERETAAPVAPGAALAREGLEAAAEPSNNHAAPVV
jgi:sec-independent protein translocase protein TatB